MRSITSEQAMRYIPAPFGLLSLPLASPLPLNPSSLITPCVLSVLLARCFVCLFVFSGSLILGFSVLGFSECVLGVVSLGDSQVAASSGRYRGGARRSAEPMRSLK
jgi:hypothetical protein